MSEYSFLDCVYRGILCLEKREYNVEKTYLNKVTKYQLKMATEKTLIEKVQSSGFISFFKDLKEFYQQEDIRFLDYMFPKFEFEEVDSRLIGEGVIARVKLYSIASTKHIDPINAIYDGLANTLTIRDNSLSLRERRMLEKQPPINGELDFCYSWIYF